VVARYAQKMEKGGERDEEEMMLQRKVYHQLLKRLPWIFSAWFAFAIVEVVGGEPEVVGNVTVILIMYVVRFLVTITQSWVFLSLVLMDTASLLRWHHVLQLPPKPVLSQWDDVDDEEDEEREEEHIAVHQENMAGGESGVYAWGVRDDASVTRSVGGTMEARDRAESTVRFESYSAYMSARSQPGSGIVSGGGH